MEGFALAGAVTQAHAPPSLGISLGSWRHGPVKHGSACPAWKNLACERQIHSELEGTPPVKSRSYPRPVLDGGRESLISSAGSVLIAQTIRLSGLDQGLSAALSPWRGRRRHDPGKALLDVAMAVALGGDCLADVAASGHRRRSTPWRWCRRPTGTRRPRRTATAPSARPAPSVSISPPPPPGDRVDHLGPDQGTVDRRLRGHRCHTEAGQLERQHDTDEANRGVGGGEGPHDVLHRSNASLDVLPEMWATRPWTRPPGGTYALADR